MLSVHKPCVMHIDPNDINCFDISPSQLLVSSTKNSSKSGSGSVSSNKSSTTPQAQKTDYDDDLSFEQIPRSYSWSYSF